LIPWPPCPIDLVPIFSRFSRSRSLPKNPAGFLRGLYQSQRRLVEVQTEIPTPAPMKIALIGHRYSSSDVSIIQDMMAESP
jgi:hypothetical protein